MSPKQLELFDMPCWEDLCESVMKTMPNRFYFSDFRKKVGASPRHPNQWGSIPKSKYWRRQFKLSGRFRKSPITERKGAMEFEWERK